MAQKFERVLFYTLYVSLREIEVTKIVQAGLASVTFDEFCSILGRSYF
jgi:hypothetical protein